MGAEGELPVGEQPRRGGAGGGTGPPAAINQAQFISWKRRKDAVAAEKKAESARKREEDIAAGTVQMNGRELFLHEPWVFDNSRY